MSINLKLNEITRFVDEIKFNTHQDYAESTKIINLALEELNELIEREGNIPAYLKGKIIDTLCFVDDSISSNFKNNEIGEIFHRIVNINDLIYPAENNKNHKISLKIGLYLDINASDFNGVILENALLALKEGLPFITTKSILQGTGISNWEDSLLMSETTRNYLLWNESQWMLFQTSKESNFILFFPKSLFLKRTVTQVMFDFDFAPQNIIRVSLSDAFQTQEDESTDIKNLFDFFDENAKINKLFYLCGHGDSSAVGSLNSSNYSYFYNFLENQNCKGLLINSCQSGGVSSLWNIPNHTFFVSVISTGDFDTYAQIMENHIKKLLDNLAICSQEGKLSTFEFKKAFESVGASSDGSLLNLAKVYFPCKAGVPRNFQLIRENDLAFPLTYEKVQGIKLLSKPSPFKKEGDFVVNNKYLAVYPLIIDCPILFSDKESHLVSMVPGNSHHFFSSIELAFHIEEFFKKLISTSEYINVYKSFFIESLKSEDGIYSEVILLCGPKVYSWAYNKNDIYYLNTNGSEKEITPFQYAIFTVYAYKTTMGLDKAVFISTLGQQNERAFAEVLKASKFNANRTQFTQDVLRLIDQFNNYNKNELFKMISQLNNDEKVAVILHTLKTCKVDLAFELVVKYDIDPNSVDLLGTPIICRVLYSGNKYSEATAKELAKYLINKNINLNVTDPWRKHNSPLHIMVLKNYLDMIKLAFQQHQATLDINIKNLDKKTPLDLSISHPEVFNLLIAHQASINHIDKTGKTFLFSLIKKGNEQQIDRILKAQADPNIGKPSAFSRAIEEKNVSLVEKFLSHGAKPFEKDESGYVPFVIAIFQDNQGVIELFLNHQDCDLNVVDKFGMTPLVCALLRNNRKLLSLLKHKNVTFTTFDTLPELCLDNLKRELIINNNNKRLKEIELFINS